VTDDAPFAQPPRLADVSAGEATAPIEDSGVEVEVIDGWVELADVSFVDRTIVLPDAEGIELANCTLKSCRLITATDAVVRAARTSFVDCDLSQAHFKSAQRCRFTSCKMAGTSIVGEIADCEFVDCQLRLTALVMTQISRTAFVTSELLDVDLQESKLSDVSFVSSRLTDVSLHRTTFERVDLRGTMIESLANVQTLDGCLVAPHQLYELAPVLAGIVGLTVDG